MIYIILKCNIYVLVVYAIISLEFTDLNLTTPFSSIILLEGDTVRLSCTPSVLKTVLSWTHNGRDVTESENISFSPSIRNHNLILKNLSVDDGGMYICLADLDDEIVEKKFTVKVVAGTYFCTYIRIYNYYACIYVCTSM